MRSLDSLPLVLCINLKSRHDRLASARREISRLDPCLPFDRIDAAKDDLNPRRGCARSHRMALSRGLESQLLRVLVIEDDVAFSDGARDHLFLAMQRLPSAWDVLLLGIYYTTVPTSAEVWVPVSYFQGAHAIIYSRSAMETILARPNIIVSYDEFLAALIAKKLLRCHLINPAIAIQYAGYSNINLTFSDPNNVSGDLRLNQKIQQEIYELLAVGEAGFAISLARTMTDQRMYEAMKLLITRWSDI